MERNKQPKKHAHKHHRRRNRPQEKRRRRRKKIAVSDEVDNRSRATAMPDESSASPLPRRHIPTSDDTAARQRLLSASSTTSTLSETPREISNNLSSRQRKLNASATSSGLRSTSHAALRSSPNVGLHSTSNGVLAAPTVNQFVENLINSRSTLELESVSQVNLDTDGALELAAKHEPGAVNILKGQDSKMRTREGPEHVAVDMETLVRTNSWVRGQLIGAPKQKEKECKCKHGTCYARTKRCYTRQVTTWLVFAGVCVALLLPEIFDIADAPDALVAPYEAVMVIIGLLLVVDVVFACVFVRNYVRQVVFYADIIGTASIALELTITRTWLLHVFAYFRVLRSARLVRVWKLARLGRLMRSVRLMRVMRLFKIEQFADKMSMAFTMGVLAIVCVSPMLTLSTWTNAWPEDFFLLLTLSSGQLSDPKTLVEHWFKRFDKELVVPIQVSIPNNTWINPGHHYADASSHTGSPFGVARSVNVELWHSPCNSVEVAMDATARMQMEAVLRLLVMLVAVACIAGVSGYMYVRVQMDLVRPVNAMFGVVDQALSGVFADRKNKALERTSQLDELHTIMQRLSRVSDLLQTGSSAMFKDMQDTSVDEATRSYLMQTLEPTPSLTPKVSRNSRVHALSLQENLYTREELALVDSLDFCPYDYDPEHLLHYARVVLTADGYLSEFGVTQAVALRFLERVRDGYSKVIPYHTFAHAVDVMQTMFHFLRMTDAQSHTDNLTLFSGLVAALGHDIGHKGLNNAYLIKTRHRLAMVYNDISVLENMHATKLFQILRVPEANVFAGFDCDQWERARKNIVQCILHTDMSRHNAIIQEAKLFYEVNLQGQALQAKAESPFLSPDCKLELMPMILHAADISNPVKPFLVYEQHAEKVMEEFFQQGDMERFSDLEVSPLNDRTNSSVAKAQVGFIEFAVAPLYAVLLEIFPALNPCIQHLFANRDAYVERHLKETEGGKPRQQLVAAYQSRRARLADKFPTSLAAAAVESGSPNNKPRARSSRNSVAPVGAIQHSTV